MKMADIVATKDAERGFYPTPPAIAEKMMEGLNFHWIDTILEPSAGKGDLVKALSTKNQTGQGRGRYFTPSRIQIDCCESDPYLRQILRYNFSEDAISGELETLKTIRMNGSHDEERNIEQRINIVRKANMRIVHDDFLTYRGKKHYDLIFMNPPFANGDLHLLHAIDMQKDGGSIICLLNAETLRNPCTNSRKILRKHLKDFNAEIEYIDDAFKDAERSAVVDVAIIKIHIPQKTEYESDIWQRMKKAVEEEEIPDPELRALVAGDYIDQAITAYQTEIAAGLEFYRGYLGLKPYICNTLDPDAKYKSSIIEIKVHGAKDYDGFKVNDYLRAVRMKYWYALFENKQFIGMLTSELQERFRKNVERLADYDFSAFNIKQIMAEMNASMTDGVEKAIDSLFEKLTSEHSWYPECGNNIHYYNGWATNKAHKIGKKCIIPTSGMFSSWSWSRNTFDVSTAFDVISDIEKVFDYLDTGETKPVDLREILEAADKDGQTRNIECKYFKVSIFKKGTTHIMFYPESMRLVERLNIYAGKRKNWLPPNYGKTTYADLSGEERAVVDSFHGNGKNGSGEKKYQEVMANASFYLESPVNNVLFLVG